MDSNEYSAAVTENIRKAIEAHGETLNSIAPKAAIPYETLRRRIASQGGSPFSAREIKAIADALGTTAHQLFTVYKTERQVA